MREPPLRVRLLGHPLVAVPVSGMSLFSFYLCSQNGAFLMPAIMGLIAMTIVGRASQHRMDFVRWRRAWEAMADGGHRSPRGPMLGKLAALLIVPAGFLAVEGGALDHAGKPADWAVLAIVGAACWATISRARRWLAGGLRMPAMGRRARSASRSDVVSICARSVMRVRSLEDAYRALPAHCWRVLNQGIE